MFELKKHEFTRVTPLLSGLGQRVLPYAICEGINPGRVFVDRLDDPRVALLWTPGGYYFLTGNPILYKEMDEISQVLTDIFIPASQATGEIGFILIISPESWKVHLPELLPEREVIEIYRKPFDLDISRFSAQGNWRKRIPTGFQLLPVDAEMAEQIGVLNSWASGADFQARGLGFVLMKSDEIVSACSSVFASDEWVEVNVHTAENYRRRGFATLTGSAMIEACLQQGRQPNWECFWNNEASIALAVKLGFRARQDYPVYYWEEKPDEAYP